MVPRAAVARRRRVWPVLTCCTLHFTVFEAKNDEYSVVGASENYTHNVHSKFLWRTRYLHPRGYSPCCHTLTIHCILNLSIGLPILLKSNTQGRTRCSMDTMERRCEVLTLQ